MFRPLLRLANFGLLIAVFFLSSQPSHADTLLVGTSLVGTTPGPELCPLVNGCNDRFSQFSTPQSFVVDDVKVAIAGPGLGGEPPNGNFQVSIITIPKLPGAFNLVANVGSGSLSFNSNGPVVTQIFDFSGLSILLDPGVEYYLEVTGGNLSWNRDTPLSGTFGTLGLQLECAVDSAQCGTSFNVDTFHYGEQISGDPVPEPSTWLFLTTGLLCLCGLLYSHSGQRRFPPAAWSGWEAYFHIMEYEGDRSVDVH